MTGWGLIRPREFVVNLGTATTQIASPTEGLLLEEPSVVALQQGTRQLLGRGAAVGKLARQLLGRTTDSIYAVCPVQHSVITDFELCEAMLGHFLSKVGARGRLFRPRLLVTAPSRMTPVERRALLNSAERAGAGSVRLVAQTKAAAIGSGLSISEPLAHLVCNMGAGTTEIAVFSLAEAISWHSSRNAGNELDQTIVEYLRNRYSLRIGIQTAEQVKIRIGSAWALAQETSMEVRGLDSIAGIPRRAVVTSEEIRLALQNPLSVIVEQIKGVIERCKPELVADLADTGLTLMGGGAVLPGLSTYMTENLGIPTRVAADPSRATIRGACLFAQHMTRWQGRLELSENQAA